MRVSRLPLSLCQEHGLAVSQRCDGVVGQNQLGITPAGRGCLGKSTEDSQPMLIRRT